MQYKSWTDNRRASLALSPQGAGGRDPSTWAHQDREIDGLVPGMVVDTGYFADAALLGFDRGELVTIRSSSNEAF